MFGTTMMLTVGQALDRAMNEEMPIRIHVAGEWVSGRVVNTDSQGVVVLDENGDACVMRMDAITCVRIPGAASEVTRTPDLGGGRVDRLPSQPQQAWSDA